jgi:hypothetical protein
MQIAFCLFPALLLASSLSQASVCTPSFMPEQNKELGWQGADAAYSIPLEDGRSIWIFGDTLYGKERVVRGNEPRMVHNSLGVSTCDASGTWHLDYVIKHDAAGHAQSYFSPANPHHWYWAMDGFAAQRDLWVLLLCVEPATSPAPDGVNFKACGSDLVRVSHLDRDPQLWEVTIHSLVPDGTGAYPSATAVVHDNFAYLFAVYELGKRPLVSARVTLTGLDQPISNLQYLASDGEWEKGFVPANAKRIMEQGSPELSIRYHPELKQWIAIMFDPNGFSDKILMRTATELTGPWTAGQVIYHVPEMSPGPSRNKNTFCYAAKEHPEFEQKGQLLFTYVCNTMDVPSLATNTKIYFPQVITLSMPR